MNIAKFLTTLILKNIFERLLMNFIAPNGKISALDTNQIKKILGRFKVEASINNNRKNLWIIRKRFENPVEHLRWSFHILYSEQFISGISQGCEYASNKTRQNPSALPFISQKIRTAISIFKFNFIFTLLTCSEALSQIQCT